MQRYTFVLLSAVLALVIAGCMQYTTPVAPLGQLTDEHRNFQSAWDASLKMLRKYNFEVKVQDRRAGLIETEPLLSQVVTEPWRRDAATVGQAWENTLQTIYRTATVRIQPVDAAGRTFKPVVQIEVARSDRREPQVTSTSAAYSLFDGSGFRKLTVGYGQDDADIVLPGKKLETRTPLGRDSALENELTAEIEAAR